jgi:hypothetical protein
LCHGNTTDVTKFRLLTSGSFDQPFLQTTLIERKANHGQSVATFRR